MLAQGWKNASADTIRNCFKKAFHEVAQEDQIENSGVEDHHDFRDDVRILAAKEELGTKEPPVDVTLDAFFWIEAEKLVSEQNEEIEDEVLAVEPKLMTVSDLMKQLRLAQRSMTAKEIEGWASLEDASFYLQAKKWLLQTTLNDYWTLH